MSTLVCPHCGADQHEIEKDIIAPLRERISELGRMLDNCMTDAAELTAERDAARAQLATYQRREALRQ